jgi:hypothetical protein
MEHGAGSMECRVGKFRYGLIRNSGRKLACVKELARMQDAGCRGQGADSDVLSLLPASRILHPHRERGAIKCGQSKTLLIDSIGSN